MSAKPFSPTGALGVRFVEEFRRIDPKFSIQWQAAFLKVAEEGELRLKDLAEFLGVSSSSATMIVLGLSTGLRPGEEGFDLVETVPSLEDRRAKDVRLTAKGKRLLRALEDHHTRHFPARASA